MSRTLDNVLILSLLAGGVFLSFSGSQIYGIGMLTLGLLYFIWSKRAGFFMFAAQMSFRSKGLDGALVWMRKAYKSGTMDPRAQVNFAYQLLKKGVVSEARSVLDRLISRGTREAGKGELQLAQSYLALVLWKEGELHQAVNLLEKLLEEGYHTSAMFGSLGYFLLEKGDLDRALSVNLQGMEFSGQDKVIMDNLGYTHYLQGNLDRALELYKVLETMNPRFPEAWYNYGLVCQKLGQKEEAREHFEKALSLDFNALSTVTKPQVEEALRKVQPPS